MPRARAWADGAEWYDDGRMDTSDFLALGTHMTWADVSVAKATLAATAARADDRLRQTLHHIHQVQHVFVQAWRGEPMSLRALSEFPDTSDLLTWGRQAHGRVLDFLMEAPAGLWIREFREPWTSQFESRMHAPAAPHTLGESVMQVMMHTAHHRGQACTRLRELGVEPPTVDFIVWLWGGRPDADGRIVAPGPASQG